MLMKLLHVLTICLMFGLSSVGYANVFADKTPSTPGCEEGDFYKCEVWQVTPNGAGMILEKGYNSNNVIN